MKGNNLRVLRQEAKVTMADVAEYLGLNPSMIWKYEQGLALWSKDTSKKLIGYFYSRVPKTEQELIDLLMSENIKDQDEARVLVQLRATEREKLLYKNVCNLLNWRESDGISKLLELVAEKHPAVYQAAENSVDIKLQGI